ncbi:MAG: NAD(P)-dependent oxidoreductase [Phycisphaeraceae bacterium]
MIRPEESAQGRETVIVTGSSGLIGSAIVNRLAHRYRILAWDKVEPTEPLPDAAAFEKIDLTSDEAVDQRVAALKHTADGRVASVVHLAAYYDFSGEPSPFYDKVTVRGSERLITALRRHDIHTDQFLFSSTMLVHRPTRPGEPIHEDSTTAPTWDYPNSKLRTESVLHKHHGDIRLLILRVAGVYTDYCNSIPIAQQIRRIRERQMTSRVFPGDAHHGQAWVHLDDLVDALERGVDRRTSLPPELAILIGEPDVMSYEQIQQVLGKLIHGERWATHRIPKTLAKTGAWVQNRLPGAGGAFIKPWMIDFADAHYELDISRARLVLDWEPRHRLRDTLTRMVAALKADPAAWYRAHGFEAPARQQA